VGYIPHTDCGGPLLLSQQACVGWANKKPFVHPT
jgi:hypothetical protein